MLLSTLVTCLLVGVTVGMNHHSQQTLVASTIDDRLRLRQHVRKRLMQETILGAFFDDSDEHLFSESLDYAVEQELVAMNDTSMNSFIVYFTHFNETTTLDNFMHVLNAQPGTVHVLSVIPVLGTDDLPTDTLVFFEMPYGLAKHIPQVDAVADWIVVPRNLKVLPSLREAVETTDAQDIDVDLLYSVEAADRIREVCAPYEELFTRYQPQADPDDHDRYQTMTLYGVPKNLFDEIIDLLIQVEGIISIRHHEPTSVFASMRATMSNSGASWMLQTGVLNSRAVWDNGVTGTGQVIQVVDAGLDTRSCFFSEQGATPFVSPDVSRRCASGLPNFEVFQFNQPTNSKVVRYFAFSDCNTPTANGHGTSVSGCAAGDAPSNSQHSTQDGLAFNAKISFYDIGVPGGGGAVTTPVDIGMAFRGSRSGGAFIHTNSWGKRIQPGTGLSEQDMSSDNYLYTNQDAVVLFAAGNYGRDPVANPIFPNYIPGPTVGSPCISKNAICVGASDNPSSSNRGIAAFSSIGPTADGRFKPDLVAPGSQVQTASSSAFGSETCALNQPSGTSFSTPYLAGAAALIREYLTEGYYPSGEATESDKFTPMGALIKAMLINSAEYLSGQYHDEDLTFGKPSVEQGFGEVRLDNVLAFSSSSAALIETSSRKLADGKQESNDKIVLGHNGDGSSSANIHGGSSASAKNESNFETTFLVGDNDNRVSLGTGHRYEVHIQSNGTYQLKCTLAWYDPESSEFLSPSSPTLVNDLDLAVLQVTSFDETEQVVLNTYFPNGLTGPDSRNNVEQVSVDLGAGMYVVRVTGKRVMTSSQQPFALVLRTGLDVVGDKNDNAASSLVPSFTLVALCATLVWGNLA